MAKVFVYCGEDYINSRNDFLKQLEQLRNEGYEIIKISPQDLSAESLENFLGNSNLFGKSNVLAVENFLSEKNSLQKEKIIEKISSFVDAIIIFWEEREFSKSEQLKYNKFTFQNYKLQSFLFKFLEQIKKSDKIGNFDRLSQAFLGNDENFVFLMMVRQFRMLIQAVDESLDNLPIWQKGKLSLQAKDFGRDKLLEIYQKLLNIDYQQKTSRSAFNLKQELELLVMEI